MKNRLFGLPISLIVAVMVVLGALVQREFFLIGRWVVVVALVFYVLSNFRFAVSVVKTVKKRARTEIVRALIVFAVAIILISILVSDTIPFFFIIFFLASDYLNNR